MNPIANFFRNMPPVTKNLLIINVIVWIAMAMVRPIAVFLQDYGALYYITSEQFVPTQLFTYMFIHADFTHLFFNMFALVMFGTNMERVLGSPKFLFYYLSCGLGAALVQEGVFAIMINHYAHVFTDPGAVTSLLSQVKVPYSELFNIGIDPSNPAVGHIFSLYHTPTVGASGAIYGILLAFGYMFPNLRVYLMIPPMPLKARTMVIGYAALELVLGLISFSNQADQVAHFAHLGGMLFGLLILIYWRKKRIIGGPYF